MRPLAVQIAFALLAATAQSNPTYSSTSFSAKCASLASNLTLANYHKFHVSKAEYVPANTTLDFDAEGVNKTCIDASSATLVVPKNICRVVLNVATSNASSVILESWLPENWNGRFLSTGNGGFAGCIQYPDIAYGTQHGFATVGTDNGHNGTSGGAFFRQPEVLRDFVWRALYTGVVVGKDVTQQFYGQAHNTSYYFGCSTGGRQGWKAVQSFPELFDGVIAGAPAFPFLGLLAQGGKALTALGTNGSETWLKPENWVAVNEEVLRQCDKLDGVADSIVEDTRKCNPDLSTLLCDRNTTQAGCLSRSQLSTLTTIFAPYIVNGTFLSPGATTSGDELPYASFLTSDQLTSWGREWFQYVVYEDPNWELSTFSSEDALNAVQQNPFNIQTYDTDISAFRKRGGRVLHYHGQADPILDVKNSDRYYDLVSKTLNATSQELDEFYRYFRISGMNHCGGGKGAWEMGQLSIAVAGDDADDNMLTRIVEWVENGEAPEFVRGTKFVNDDPRQGVSFRRKHCKHPKSNVYKGSGNGTDEEGWQCV